MQQGNEYRWLVRLSMALTMIAFGGAIYYTTECHTQSGRPNPGGSPAPLVPESRDVMALFEQVKLRAEGEAVGLKRGAREGRLTDEQLRHGERLYGRVREDANGTLAYLQTAMLLRFREEDGPKVRQQLEATATSLKALDDWYAKAAEAYDGDVIAIKELLDGLATWLARVSEEDQLAIAETNRKMEAAKQAPWGDIP